MARRQTVYFAYGSNLHLGQMSTRCPESRFLGRAKLNGYRWLINSRGYANIADSPSECVEGLCFLLSQNDERRLDVNEGVSTGAYAKEMITVKVWSAGPLIAGRRCAEVSDQIHSHSSEDRRRLEQQKQSQNQLSAIDNEEPLDGTSSALLSSESQEPSPVDVLVYINRDKTTSGKPKAEYIGRINLGIEDALLLGVSQEFVDRIKANMRWPLEAAGTVHNQESSKADSRLRDRSGGVALEGAQGSLRDDESDTSPGFAVEK